MRTCSKDTPGRRRPSLNVLQQPPPTYPLPGRANERPRSWWRMLAGELTATTAQAFQEHLPLCKDCVAYVHTYKATIAATRVVRHDDIPAALQERLYRFLHEHGLSGAKEP